jgi:hypothetical protein
MRRKRPAAAEARRVAAGAVDRSAAAAAATEAVVALAGAAAAAAEPDAEGAGGAIGRTDGTGKSRRGISMRRTTTAAAADGAGETVAAEAAAEATHGEADVSGHRPSPEGEPGAAEEPITEVTSSKFLLISILSYLYQS